MSIQVLFDAFYYNKSISINFKYSCKLRGSDDQFVDGPKNLRNRISARNNRVLRSTIDRLRIRLSVRRLHAGENDDLQQRFEMVSNNRLHTYTNLISYPLFDIVKISIRLFFGCWMKYRSWIASGTLFYFQLTLEFH